MLRRSLTVAACVWVMSGTAGLGAQVQSGRRGVTLTVSVTEGTGAPVQGARVIVTGPVNREGETIANGTIRVTGLRAGTYRVRVEHVRFITLEREVTMRTQSQTIEMTLSDAPPPPEPEPVEAPPPDPAQADTPPGEPRTLVVADFVEKNFIGSRDPIKEDELGCTASARTRLVQLRESTKEESSPDADEVIYVVAGEGTLRLGNKDVPLDSSALAVVPRGTARSLSRKGRNPLIVLSVVSGPSCTGQAGQAGQ